jgi:hypothetical protein
LHVLSRKIASLIGVGDRAQEHQRARGRAGAVIRFGFLTAAGCRFQRNRQRFLQRSIRDAHARTW